MRTAVIRFFSCYNPATPRELLADFHRTFRGFGARVGEVDRIEPMGEYSQQLRGQGYLRSLHKFTIYRYMQESVELGGDRLEHLGVSMAYIAYRKTRYQIDILFAIWTI